MDPTVLIETLEGSGLSEWMRSSLKALPVIESIHVMAVSIVFGTIAIVDFRLIGWLDAQRPFTRVFGEVLTWTWIGFGVAVVTGSLMFMPNASTYVANTAFAWKMGALLCAGVNMAVFQFTTLRRVDAWDAGVPPPGARAAGAASLVIWTSVIFFGRWIGFTKGYDFSIPEDMDFDFLGSCLQCVCERVLS